MCLSNSAAHIISEILEVLRVASEAHTNSFSCQGFLKLVTGLLQTAVFEVQLPRCITLTRYRVSQFFVRVQGSTDLSHTPYSYYILILYRTTKVHVPVSSRVLVPGPK